MFLHIVNYTDRKFLRETRSKERGGVKEKRRKENEARGRKKLQSPAKKKCNGED